MIVTLGEITDSCLGKMLDAEKNVGEYQPYLANINVRWGSFDTTSLSQMKFEPHENDRYGIRKGDLIVCEGGEPGRCAIWDESIPNMKIQKALHRVRAKSGTDIRYIYYWLLLAGKQNLLEGYFTGSTIKHLPGDKLKSITLDLPDFATQSRISDILSLVDAKIKCNMAINDNLQQMAYETYMHLFFGKSANGKLGDLIVENGKSTVQVGTAKDSVDGEYPFFTSGDAILRWNTSMVDGCNCYLNTGGNADVKFYVGAAAYSTDTWCITATNGFEDYLYLLLLSIKSELNQKFFQGTGLKHLQKPLLKDRPIYIPDKTTIDEFNLSVQPWFDMIAANINENQRLISLRDWLLPMLMNGQAIIAD